MSKTRCRGCVVNIPASCSGDPAFGSRLSKARYRSSVVSRRVLVSSRQILKCYHDRYFSHHFQIILQSDSAL
jgi:hypothetical protein